MLGSWQARGIYFTSDSIGVQMKRITLYFALVFASGLFVAPIRAASGIDAVLAKGSGGDEFLPPEQAFQVSAKATSPDQIALQYVIAPGYYLYRERLKFASSSPGVAIGKPDLPAGENHTDEFFGTQIVYREILDAKLAVSRAAGGELPMTVDITYQGCADAGLCYPPQKASLTVTLPEGGAVASAGVAQGGGAAAGATVAATPAGYVSEQDRLARLIRGGSLFAMLSVFFGLGITIAFTGCVLPTVPILSGIIVGQGGKTSTLRAFMLSLTYVLGMAFTYTLAGALTAASGLQVQALFQKTWIVLLFAAMMLAMAASMFGAFALQMPSSIQTRISEISNRQRGGTFGGAAIMGALSSLIVTACVAPAMVAALAVISQSGNVVRGASALFAMSIGMGAPLLVVGASAGKLLPKAGAWMDDVKRLAGCLMLGVAVWMLSRLVSDRTAMLLFTIPALAALWVLWRFAVRGNARLITRIAAVACGLYAAALIVGYARGATDPLHPLQARAAQAGPEFQAIRTLGELDAAVASAAAAGKPVMLDFYADWCVSCKEMERYTFSEPAIRNQLQQALLLRADVTANNSDDQALLKRFGIFGPPTIAFYDGHGKERSEFRVVGYMKAPAFAEVLQQVFAAP
jgi:thiol:disulfide interchange protein DsbD